MSPQKWIKETNAVGIIPKSGNNVAILNFYIPFSLSIRTTSA